MGEEIDLTRWVDALLKRWWLMLAGMAVCIAAALAAQTVLPVSYRATALVATIRERTDVRLTDEIRTLTEYDLRPFVNDTKRLETFVKMAPNPLIAETVIAEMGDALPADYRNADRLVRMVSGSVANGSDAIQIVVTARDSSVPVAIVNAWAKAYVDLINDSFGELNQETILAIDKQAIEAQAVYERRQADLEQAYATSQVDRYEQELAGQIAALESLVQGDAAALRRALSNRERTAWLVESARMLRPQIADAETVLPSSAQTLALIQAQAMALELPALDDTAAFAEEPVSADGMQDASVYITEYQMAQTGTQLHLHLGEGEQPSSWSQADALATLDGLTESLGERLSRLNVEIDQRLAQGGEGTAQAILALDARIRESRAKLEQAQAVIDEATIKRDMARETTEVLERKQAELRVSTEGMGAQVRLVVPASSPTSTGQPRERIIAIAGMAGLVLGVVVAVALELWSAMRQRNGGAARTTD